MSSQNPTTTRRFKPAVDVSGARLLKHRPAFIKRKRSRGRFAVGVRYERQVQDELALLALGRDGLQYLEGPWFEYNDRTGKRWCQPDGLLIDSKQKAIVIYEVKYQHCLEAYFQLHELYYPVVRAAYPEYRPVVLMEIVHWYDPAVVFPQRCDLTDSPFRVPHANKIAVWIFNPKRSRGTLTDRTARVAGPGYNGGQGGSETPGGQPDAERSDGSDGSPSSGRGGVVHEGSDPVSAGAKGST